MTVKIFPRGKATKLQENCPKFTAIFLIEILGLDMIVSQRSIMAAFFLGVHVTVIFLEFIMQPWNSISSVGTNTDLAVQITNPKDVINRIIFVTLIGHSISM